MLIIKIGINNDKKKRNYLLHFDPHINGIYYNFKKR